VHTRSTGYEIPLTTGRDHAPACGGVASIPDGGPRAAATARDAGTTDLPDSPQHAAARSRWARLLARIYEVCLRIWITRTRLLD
jgi:hypothetical protein